MEVSKSATALTDVSPKAGADVNKVGSAPAVVHDVDDLPRLLLLLCASSSAVSNSLGSMERWVVLLRRLVPCEEPTTVAVWDSSFGFGIFRGMGVTVAPERAGENALTGRMVLLLLDSSSDIQSKADVLLTIIVMIAVPIVKSL